MLKPEQEDCYSDIEDALKSLRPVDFSAHFWDSLDTRLSREETEGVDDNTVNLQSKEHVMFFPLRRIATSAAMLAGAVGLGIWGYSAWRGEISQDGAPATPMLLASESVKAARPMVAKRTRMAIKNSPSRDGVRLVTMERQMNSVKPAEIIEQEDGSLARRVKYSYMDEYYWEDKDANIAFVELRPHEEVLSMELAVY